MRMSFRKVPIGRLQGDSEFPFGGAFLLNSQEQKASCSKKDKKGEGK